MHHHQNHGALAPGLAAPELAAIVHPSGVAALGIAAAAHPGLIEPRNDEAPRLAGAEGFRNQGKTDNTHCAGPTAADQPIGRFSTLAAHAAIAGCGLHELAGGGYLLCKWGMARELPDLRAVVALMRQMGIRT